MQTPDELAELIRQRTWDKELLLWFGPEIKLLPLLASVHVDVLDLLDLFEPASIPDTGPDDMPLRLMAMERIKKEFKKS